MAGDSYEDWYERGEFRDAGDENDASERGAPEYGDDFERDEKLRDRRRAIKRALSIEQRESFENWKRGQDEAEREYARRRFAWKLTADDREFLRRLRISADE